MVLAIQDDIQDDSWDVNHDTLAKTSKTSSENKQIVHTLFVFKKGRINYRSCLMLSDYHGMTNHRYETLTIIITQNKLQVVHRYTKMQLRYRIHMVALSYFSTQVQILHPHPESHCITYFVFMCICVLSLTGLIPQTSHLFWSLQPCNINEPF